MNAYYDIIPTPKYFDHTEGSALRICSVALFGGGGKMLECAVDMLTERCGCVRARSNAELSVYAGLDAVPAGLLDSDDLATFSEKYADSQGYVIKRGTDGKIFVAAMTDAGCAYGIMTLIQLLGRDIGAFVIRDFPDFKLRGTKWTVWAETGGFSYDFGDGIEAMCRRVERKIDNLFLYKTNYIYADGFGFDADRFEGYSDMMRHLSDYARARGIYVAVGGYTMSYGMVGHLNSYQGRHFENRTSYPDGEIYECIGTFEKKHPERGVKAPTKGTCLSNRALFDLKMDEICDFVRKTHITALAFHNMDADEIHPELWAARCPACRRRWPNDSLFAKDGCAGAFAEFIDNILERVGEIKDGDYDASRDLIIRMSSPGYLYAKQTDDETFDMGVEFWASVAKYVKDKKRFGIGFREQFFYHEKPERRVTKVLREIDGVMTSIQNFCGADGFYDDKIFTITGALSYMQHGYDNHFIMNGNAFQEPLAIFNAEYLWNSENSAFYNVSPRPADYESFMALYEDMLKSRVRPTEIYGNGGFIDVICKKLYGENIGALMARVYKLGGKCGEPPIACSANVDIYTNYTKVVYPMRWDNELTPGEISTMTERFSECARMSAIAYETMREVLAADIPDGEIRGDLEWLCDAFFAGSRLTALLYEYMKIFATLDAHFSRGEKLGAATLDALDALHESAREYERYTLSSGRKTLDKFEGPFIRRTEMAEFLVYNTEIMKKSIEQEKRLPDGRRPLRTREWW